VIIDPDEEQLEFFAQKVQIIELIHQKQARLKATACKTKDDVVISLSANIEIPEELPTILDLDCDGIGLFRTEFIYLSSDSLPDEEAQYLIYRDIVSALNPQPVTIRTFDLGGDKLPQISHFAREHNPYLGNRGIRLSLAHPEILKTQLRAIIRASAHGKVKIMFPMVIDVDDFIAARNIFNRCMDEIYAEGYEYDSSIALGCMVEIPSAALTSETLAQECDFLSIGTNDLVQYTLAVDRNNDAVSRYYIQHHPAVLKLIRATIINATKYEKPVSVCGEMASLPEYIPLLIGMGITELSVSPGAYYEAKSIIQNCDHKLRMIVKHFDFSTSLPKVEELVFSTLKNYYKSDGSYL
ncbi:MAG TPA: phosphoenolpyruvate--protein phosphotransferase, partial [Candidatus Cloacimonadota bacterium]|nr:phosphoenolpyruvate--protein phosphotransferase [Candidatus Cloacimonadota bacterium]